MKTINLKRFWTQLRTVSEAPIGKPGNLSFTLDLPHKVHGEDGPPIHQYGSATDQFIGVFDGMGGAGATLHKTADGVYTGARIAAFECSKLYADWLTEGGDSFDIAQLARRFRGVLDATERRFPDTNSIIKSKMIRRFPTTAAVAKLSVEDPGVAVVNCGWAGDSRIYALSPQQGLSQISMDHTKNYADAQENLALDTPLSNYMHAGNDFYLDCIKFYQALPVALIAATDGCFGYVLSPVYFEIIILEAIVRSSNAVECTQFLKNSIAEVTSDDASMAIAFAGWSNWETLRESFQKRLFYVQQKVAAFDSANQNVVALTRQLKLATDQRSSELAALWLEYRNSYETQLQTRQVGTV